MDSTNLYLAAEIHNSVKKDLLDFISTNNLQQINLNQLRNFIQTNITTKVNDLYSSTPHLQTKTPYNFGLAFPIGLSVDSVVAHYTPVNLPQSIQLESRFDPNSTLDKFRIIKVDYGVTIEGAIVDSAFSLNLDGSTDVNTLITASQEITTKVANNLRVDVYLNELADIANEIVESYDNPKTLTPLKLIENVYSHNILPWNVHGGKFIRPDYKKYNENHRVEEGELYAIEFYPTTGSGIGKLSEQVNIYSHYSVKEEFVDKIPLFDSKDINKVITTIQSKLNKLPFCPNFMEANSVKTNHSKTIRLLQKLYQSTIVKSYPPIIECDDTAMVAQTEATVEIYKDGCSNVVCGIIS